MGKSTEAINRAAGECCTAIMLPGTRKPTANLLHIKQTGELFDAEVPKMEPLQPSPKEGMWGKGEAAPTGAT